MGDPIKNMTLSLIRKHNLKRLEEKNVVADLLCTDVAHIVEQYLLDEYYFISEKIADRVHDYVDSYHKNHKLIVFDANVELRMYYLSNCGIRTYGTNLCTNINWKDYIDFILTGDNANIIGAIFNLISKTFSYREYSYFSCICGESLELSKILLNNLRSEILKPRS